MHDAVWRSSWQRWGWPWADTGIAGDLDGAVRAAQFRAISGAGPGRKGLVYLAESADHRIRVMTP